MKSFVTSLFILVFGAALYGVWQGFVFLSHGASVTPQERIFEVLPGEGFYRIAQRLEADGLVRSSLYFKVLAKVSGHAELLRVGEYAVNTGMRPMELLKVLSSGKSIEHQITFPEGWNIFEMAALVEAKRIGKPGEFLKVVRDSRFINELLGENLPSLEGYLFPETYRYSKYTEVKSLVRGMVERFKEVYATLGNNQPKSMTRAQVVTLASVIEKETGAPEERPMISSVFHNRLKRGMRLQSDPTIIYGIWIETGSEKKNLTRDDITRPTLYNTYTVAALPVGPISNPGRASLDAVLHPANSEYFFFVSQNDGTHKFSESLEQHNSAVKKYQIDKSARVGKSWRDLNQKTKKK